MLNAVGAHLGNDVGDVGMPVAHGYVNFGGSIERLFEKSALAEGPLCEWRRLGL